VISVDAHLMPPAARVSPDVDWPPADRAYVWRLHSTPMPAQRPVMPLPRT
jgi:hypothetical protein